MDKGAAKCGEVSGIGAAAACADVLCRPGRVGHATLSLAMIKASLK